MSRTRQDVITQESLQQLGIQLLKTPIDYASINQVTIETLTRKISEITQTTYDYISFNTNDFTFAKVIQPLINLEIYTGKARRICKLMKEVHPDENIRDSSLEAINALSKLSIDCEQRSDVYHILKKYENQFYASEEKNLHSEQKRYFQILMRNYKRDGLHITDDKVRNKIASIKMELTLLSTQFEKNIADLNTSFVITKSELQGLPESWFTEDRKVSSDHYRVTLQYPDYYPIMDFVRNRETRKKVYTAFHTRCVDENLPLLSKIIRLRTEQAKLLGYETHADYVTEIRMVKTKQTVRQFLNDMNSQFSLLSESLTNELKEFARKTEHDENFVLQNYDIPYYNRLMLENKFNLNTEEIDSYFNLKKMLSGTFSIYEQLLGLKFIEVKSTSVWHDEVKLFDVYNFNYDNSARGEKLGSFYLDLHPRPGKYTHAAAFDLVSGTDLSHLTGHQERQLAEVAMVCNLSRDKTLSFEPDLMTFFHEFGHVMHYICAKNTIPQCDAYMTEIDFVEAPSQMLENWCFDPKALRLLSEHPKTGAPLPDAIAIKMAAMKRTADTIEILRRLVLANFDYEIHAISSDNATQIDFKSLYQQLKQSILGIPSVPEECFVAAFSHLVGGYDVGYYGYIMSNTYAHDMYATKFKQDPLSHIAGMAYRRAILEPGATLDGMDMLKNFLGRPPRTDAFFEVFGIGKKDTSQLKEEKSYALRSPQARGLFPAPSVLPMSISTPTEKPDSHSQTLTSFK